MTGSETMRKSCKGMVASALKTPFLQGVRNGTLARSTFLTFLQHDYEFLCDYLQSVCALGYASETFEVFQVLNQFISGLLSEMEIGRSLRQDEASDGEELVVVVKEYRKMLRRGAERLVQKVAAARGEDSANAASHDVARDAMYARLHHLTQLLPCMVLYANMGTALAGIVKRDPSGMSDHPYVRWIQTYACDAFQQHTKALERLLDHWMEAYCENQNIMMTTLTEILLADAYRVSMTHEVCLFTSAAD